MNFDTINLLNQYKPILPQNTNRNIPRATLPENIKNQFSQLQNKISNNYPSQNIPVDDFSFVPETPKIHSSNKGGSKVLPFNIGNTQQFEPTQILYIPAQFVLLQQQPYHVAPAGLSENTSAQNLASHVAGQHLSKNQAVPTSSFTPPQNTHYEFLDGNPTIKQTAKRIIWKPYDPVSVKKDLIRKKYTRKKNAIPYTDMFLQKTNNAPPAAFSKENNEPPLEALTKIILPSYDNVFSNLKEDNSLASTYDSEHPFAKSVY